MRDGKNGKGDAAYLLHLDGVPAGGFENHRDGLGWEAWRADVQRQLSPAEALAYRERIETDKRLAAEESTRTRHCRRGPSSSQRCRLRTLRSRSTG